MDSVKRVSCGNKEDIGQIEWGTQEVVCELVILVGVKDLEHRTGRIATLITAHFVDFI